MKSAYRGIVSYSSRLPSIGRVIAVFAALTIAVTAASAQKAVGTVAGSVGASGFLNATGTAAQFRFTNPSGIAVDSSGNLFVADALNHVIRKIDTAGLVSTFAGTAGTPGNGDGTGVAAFFNSPQGLAIDGANNLYVADSGNHAVRMVTSAGVVTTLAGTAGGANGSIAVANGFTEGTGTTARFASPLGIAADRANAGAAVNVYVADTQNNAIRRIVVTTKAVSTVAGGGAASPGYVDSADSTARFSHPDAIASSADGLTLYVADTFNQRIRKVTVVGSVVTVSTLAGSGSTSYGEGTLTGASFNYPTGIALDAATGNVLVADTLNHVIRSVSPAGVTALVAGAPAGSGSANGLALTAARFWVPSGITSNASGIFVVDTSNQIVRRIADIAVPTITSEPVSTSIGAGGTATFTVVASGSPTPSIQWQRSTDSGGSWQSLSNGSGVAGAQTGTLTLTGVTGSMNGYQFRAVVGNGASSDIASAVVGLTVTQVPVITNTAFSFYATVNSAIAGAKITATGAPAPHFEKSSTFPTWASLDPITGDITGVPSDAASSPYTFTVTATNSVGTSTPVTFTITVQTGPTITVQPVSRSVTVGQNPTFSVVATSTTAITGYRWQRSIDSGGSWYDLSDGGVYSGSGTSTLSVSNTALAMNGDQFRVVVSNSVSTSTSNAAVLSVAQTPVFTSAPNTTFVVNQPGSFTVTATGYPTPQLSYSGSFPPWAQFYPATGVIYAMPTDTSNSPYVFTLIATSGSLTTTQTFTLSVSPTSLVPVVTTQPQSVTIGLAQNATFTVVGTGNPAPMYQWQRYRWGDADYVALTEGGQYSGTTSATLTITGATAEMDGDLYRVVLTNGLGTATSSPATLTLTAGNVFTTVAGQPGVPGSSDGLGAEAHFRAPTSMVVDSSGVMYVADSSNHVIRRIAPDGSVSTLAGVAGVAGRTDGFGSEAHFNTPTGIAIDTNGRLYVADSGNHVIRQMTTAGMVSTIAGTPGMVGNTEGVGTGILFSFPSGVAVDPVGNVYVADTLNNRIRKLVPGGGSYASMAVTFTEGGSPVALSLPTAVAVDASYNVYISDTRNNVIRKVTGATGTVLAGLAGVPGSVDGTGTAARFNQPQGLAVDAAGNVFVADTYNHTIRKITAAGVVTTIAGQAGITGTNDGGAGTVRFNQPFGVAVDSSGNVYVADTFNHAIRRSGGSSAPQIATQPVSTIVRANQPATFTVVATGVPTPSYQWQRQAAGQGGFVNLTPSSTYAGVNSATLVISSTTEAMNGDMFQVLVNNLVAPLATSNAVTLGVLAASSAPSITTQPVSASVSQGGSATFTVTAAGTGPLTYAWSLNGTVIAGATSDTLTINNAQAANSGLYTVTVSNPVSSATSIPAALFVNTPPVITSSPQAQVATVGGSATFSVTAQGGSGFIYQWRKNRSNISGANGSSYTISSVTASDAGAYDVVVTNSLGAATSSLATLTVASGATAPALITQPHTQAVLVGSSVTLNASATAAPTPTYQWRKNGVNIAGETNAALSLNNVQGSDAGTYDVVVTNSAGTAVSSSATVRVMAHSYAGVYFGSFSGGLGSFALYVRPDNTGVFLGYIPSSSAPVVNDQLIIDDSGAFTFVQPATAAAAASVIDGPQRAAALGSVSLSGSISNGVLSGTLGGAASATLSAVRSSDSGATQGSAGFFMAGSRTGSGTVLTITDANGLAYVVARNGTAADGGSGTVFPTGRVSVNTGKSIISEDIVAGSGVITGNSTGTVNGTLVGATESAVLSQRLANISTRSNVSSGDAIAIAGFVISGTDSKTVLIRGVGPTLSKYGVTGALAAPKLDLYRGKIVIASNTGLSTSADAAAIAAAGAQSGGFEIGNTDSAILITLPPGAYTAQLSSSGTAGGIALVEVYDLSAAARGQKIVNISTRAPAGAGDNMLIAGVVVNGSVPKRVLVRAIGPGLAVYGVAGTLAKPVLVLKTQDGQVIAQNTGWSTSADAADITTASLGSGGFPLTTNDSALIVTLPQGAYSAQVTSADGATGIALVEVYELQ